MSHGQSAAACVIIGAESQPTWSHIMATIETKTNQLTQLIIEYLRSVSTMTTDAKILSYIEMAIVCQLKVAR